MCSVFTVGPRFNTPVLLQMRLISIVQSLPFSKHSNVCVNGKKKQEQIKVNKMIYLFLSLFTFLNYYFQKVFVDLATFYWFMKTIQKIIQDLFCM